MKKVLSLCFAFMLCFVISGCNGGNVDKAKTHEVESELYSQQEIHAAIDTIKIEFQKNWSGCTLTEIYYAGDNASKEYQDWANRNHADEAIVLLSSFHVDHSGGNGSLNPNSTYENWNWILVRTDDGKWTHVDHGY